MKDSIKMQVALIVLIFGLFSRSTSIYAKDPDFRALVLTERGGQHENFVAAALGWLNAYSAEKNFGITVINHANDINE